MNFQTVLGLTKFLCYSLVIIRNNWKFQGDPSIFYFRCNVLLHSKTAIIRKFLYPITTLKI